MIGGNARAYADDFCSYSGKPPVSLCDDEYHGTGALDRICPAAEGTWVWVAVRSDAEFERLVGTIGLPELATDHRFARVENRPAGPARPGHPRRARLRRGRGRRAGGRRPRHPAGVTPTGPPRAPTCPGRWSSPGAD